MSTVVVTGGTGTLGREVVTRLLARQHRTRILTQQASPSAPHGVEAVFGDLASGRGVREAVAGVDAIIHARYFCRKGAPGRCGRYPRVAASSLCEWLSPHRLHLHR